MTKQKTYVVGVDIGGTKIFSGVIDQTGTVISTAKLNTLAAEGFKTSFQQIVTCIEMAIANANLKPGDIQAIGVGSPGPLDIKKGIVIETPNLKWKNVPLKASLEKHFQKPVKIDNDVNTGTFGEFKFGAGKGVQDLIGLFVGTGLGGGIIINSQLLHGFNQNAGELGHVIINPKGPRCGCGVKGHLEAYVSKTGIEKKIRKAIAKGKETILKATLHNNHGPIKSSQLAKAYFKGDKIVRKAINRSARYLGYAVASFLNIFNPEMIVLGGGLVEALGQDYVDRVKKVAEKNVFPIAYHNVRIVPAALGDHSVILGAAALAFEALKKASSAFS